MHPGQVGPYRIRHKLGAGGMGEVYLAEDTRLRRRVALKGLTAQWARASDARRRLVREARAAAALNHPNIAAVYDIVESDDTTFIVMEYVPGVTLARRLTEGPLPPGAVAFLGHQLADALTAAHSLGIVHRDLKPANLVLTPDGKLKVLDFGLAVSLGGSAVAPWSGSATGSGSADEISDARGGRLVGTPPYVPPEAYQGEAVDERGDIYSAGVVLYELLAGRRPFVASSASELAQRILSGEPERLTEIRPGIPRALEDVVRKAMSLRVEDRHPTAAALRDDLAPLRDEPADSETLTRELATLIAPGGLESDRRGPRLSRWRVGVLGLLLTGIVAAAGLRLSLSRAGVGSSQRALTVVVLPFADVASDLSLGAGLTDMLVTALAKLPRANVIGCAAIYDQLRLDPRRQAAARALGADFVVDGSVQRSGEKLLVTLSLVNAATNVVVWSDDFNGTWSQAFDFQRQVAAGVAEALELKLSEGDRQRIERMAGIGGRDAETFTQAQALLERADQPDRVARAIELFSEVARAEPRFALARAGLARALWASYLISRDPSLPTKARDATLEALRLDPYQPQVLVALAEIDAGSGRREDAVQTLRRAIMLKPDSDEAHRALGATLADSGRTEEALKELQTAVRLRPQYWKHYDTLGKVLLLASRYSEAETAYREIVRLLPESSWGYAAVGTARHAAGDRQGALEWYKKALAAQPDDSEAHSNVGYYLYEAGRFEEAAASFAEAARLQPREPSNHRNLADAYARLGRTTEARASYRGAIALVEEGLQVDPAAAGQWARLGLYRAKVQDMKGARAAIEKALALRQDEGEIQHRAAAVFALCGDKARALKALGAAVDLGYSRDFLRADEDLQPLAQTPEYLEWIGPQTKQR